MNRRLDGRKIDVRLSKEDEKLLEDLKRELGMTDSEALRYFIRLIGKHLLEAGIDDEDAVVPFPHIIRVPKDAKEIYLIRCDMDAEEDGGK